MSSNKTWSEVSNLNTKQLVEDIKQAAREADELNRIIPLIQEILQNRLNTDNQ